MVAASEKQASADALAHVKSLLRQIVRGFYQPKHCILLDVLLKHSTLRDDHISLIMGLQNYEIRELCGRLREDRLITMQTKVEYKDSQARPINRTYYYVDYRDATDAIKFRLHKLVRIIEEKSRNDFESKGYVCSYCGRRYGPLDVLPLVSSDGQGFHCADCGHPLTDDEESLESRASQERLERLQKQTSRIVGTLKEIDASFVPNNDFASAMLLAIPPAELVDTSGYPKSHLGIQQASAAEVTTTAALGVSIDYDSLQAESPEERQRRLDQAQKNQLPDWHLQSTVSSEPTVPQRQSLLEAEDEDIKATKLDAATEEQVAAYYRSERARLLQQKEESDEEDMEDEEQGDDDDAFEDVTPSAQPPQDSTNQRPDLSSNKAEASESEDDEGGEFVDV
jgi:transcription initiation factor TFIIE subunit alpha